LCSPLYDLYPDAHTPTPQSSLKSAASNTSLVLTSCLGVGESKDLTSPAAAAGGVKSCARQRAIVEQTQNQSIRLKGHFEIFIKLQQGLSNLLTQHNKAGRKIFPSSTFWAEAQTQKDSTRSTTRSGGTHNLWGSAPAGNQSPFKTTNCCSSMSEGMCTQATAKTKCFLLFFFFFLSGRNKDSAVTNLRCQLNPP